MPYRKITLADGTETPVRRVSWEDIAKVVTPGLLAQIKKSLSGSDNGKWTTFSVPLHSGSKMLVSNGREVLEQKI